MINANLNCRSPGPAQEGFDFIGLKQAPESCTFNKYQLLPMVRQGWETLGGPT